MTREQDVRVRWIEKGWAWGTSASVASVHSDGEIEERVCARDLVGGDLDVLFYPGLDHATVFDTRERRDGMLDVLHRFVRNAN